MRTYKWFCLVFVAAVLLSCKGTSEEELMGDWQKRAGYPWNGLAYASTFVIGDKGYVVGGYNGNNALRREVYVFDHTAGAGADNYGEWTALNLLPSEIPARYQAVGFSVNGKGYMGTGWAFIGTDDVTTLKDFWQYDPNTDTWMEVAPLPENAHKRRGAIAFSLTDTNGKEWGYVGCGYTDDPDRAYLSDFWRFDPDGTTDGLPGSWTPVTGYRGDKRLGAIVFVIGNKAYICCGERPANVIDFWVFDGTNWEKRRQMANTNPDEDFDDDYGGLARSFGVGYVVEVPEQGGVLRGHIVGAKTNGSSNWEYNHTPENEGGDLWVQRTSFYNNQSGKTPGNREGLISFSFPSSGRAFVGLGRSGSLFYDDLWEFKPLIEDYVYDDY